LSKHKKKKSFYYKHKYQEINSKISTKN